MLSPTCTYPSPDPLQRQLPLLGTAGLVKGWRALSWGQSLRGGREGAGHPHSAQTAISLLYSQTRCIDRLYCCHQTRPTLV